ncbi:NAD(P)H-binding protein [Rudaea sp.]|uniref:NAD(P)-dependent oxidoreductase n=1 Tax=Rudaea sp. TaxID=2136325 RepID=UPI00321FF28B
MKIALFGAGGHIGHGILNEAVARGHDVIAVVRDPDRANIRNPKVEVVVGDLGNPASYRAALEGVDAAIASLSGRRDSDAWRIPQYAATLLDVLPAAGVRRLIWVGGAGSLETAPGVTVSSSPQFPKDWLPEANAQAEALRIFRHSKADIDWTHVSPPALLVDGERSGKYRIGGNQLLVDANGVSRITVPDYAVAILDRVEKDDKPRQRITVAY